MTDTNSIGRATSPRDTPAPPSNEIQAMLASKVARPSRPAYFALMCAATINVVVAGGLLATETALPTRTQVALAVLTAMGCMWIGFSAWLLMRHTVLLGRERVVAASMSVVVCLILTVGVAILPRQVFSGKAWYGALATGITMSVASILVLVHTRRRFAGMVSRRAELERRVAPSLPSVVLLVALVTFTGDRLNAQQAESRMSSHETVQATFVVRGQSIAATQGKLLVPAQRNSADTNTLALIYFVLPSTAAKPKSPIVFLAGGPGDAGTRAVAGMPSELLSALRSIADVVVFDQRGTGQSEPRNPVCPPGPMLPTDRVANPTLYLELVSARVTRCLDSARHRGMNVQGLTTVESADDLEALRRALGAEKLSLLAGSYGTHLALVTARRHPTSIDRMVLAGVEGFDDTFKIPGRVDDVLQRIASARRPTLVRDLRALLAQLAAQPAQFTFPTGQAIIVGAWDLQRWVAESVDDVRQIDALVSAVPLMLENDFSALGKWAITYRVPRPLNLMNLAMDCASYATTHRLAEIERTSAGSIVGSAMNFPLPGLCDVLGLPRLPDAFRTTPLTSSTRALLISGGFDGRTPLSNAETIARQLPRSQTLIIDTASHGLFREQSVTDALLAFFRQ